MDSTLPNEQRASLVKRLNEAATAVVEAAQAHREAMNHFHGLTADLIEFDKRTGYRNVPLEDAGYE